MRYFFPVMLIIFLGQGLYGQQLLQKPLTYTCQGLPFTQALKEMASAGDFFFAYSPNLLPDNRQVSVSTTRGTIQEGLDQIFKGTNLTYKVVGEHVILKKKAAISSPRPKATPLAPPPRRYRLSGQVRNQSTQKGLIDVFVNIGDSINLQTDERGRFELTTEATAHIELSFHKRGYRSASLRLTVAQNLDLGFVELEPLQVAEIDQRLQEVPDIQPQNPMGDVLLVKLFVEDSLLDPGRVMPPLQEFPLQFSLLPMIGSRGLRGQYYQSSLSINLLAGYGGSVKGVELGGILNSVRQEMMGLQVGGIANVVGGHAKGVQLAGILNVNLSNINGIQMSGILNTATELKGGIQLAGITNILTYKMNGLQIGGVLNIAPGDIKGAQIAGVSNLNFREVNGLQISGILNQAKHISGIQIGLVNVAKHAQGLQIGLINIADSAQGIQLGMVNFTRHGYQGVEVGASEMWPLQLSLRLGIPRWYTIFGAKMAPTQAGYQYGYGAGFGSVLLPKKRLQPRIEATANSWLLSPQPGMHIQLKSLAEWGWGKRFYLSGGPTLNFFTAFDDAQPLDPSAPLLPYALWQRVKVNELRQQFWIGFSVSIGFRKNFLIG